MAATFPSGFVDNACTPVITDDQAAVLIDVIRDLGGPHLVEANFRDTLHLVLEHVSGFELATSDSLEALVVSLWGQYVATCNCSNTAFPRPRKIPA